MWIERKRLLHLFNRSTAVFRIKRIHIILIDYLLTY